MGDVKVKTYNYAYHALPSCRLATPSRCRVGADHLGWPQVGASINIALVKAGLNDVATQQTAWMTRKGYVTEAAATSHEIIQLDEVPVAAAIITGV